MTSAPTSSVETSIQRAAEWISQADGLLITAGAGMGVDSGLPDFRGNEGFWRAYPALAQSGIVFTEIANPAAFDGQPRLAWGFYGHRLALYRKTIPHEGFQILQRMAARLPAGAFVITSNVDGQFQKAGFSEHQIMEIHGSIHHLQCIRGCHDDIWSAQTLDTAIDETNCTLTGELPRCGYCGRLARPNILMFDDMHWVSERMAGQREHWRAWVSKVKHLVVIELGAGTGIPSIRRIGASQGCPLIRINPREAEVGTGNISLPLGARQGLVEIEKILFWKFNKQTS